MPVRTTPATHRLCAALLAALAAPALPAFTGSLVNATP